MARQIPSQRFSELVHAGTEVFIEFGYQRAQMADVASALGVAKGTLYGYLEAADLVVTEWQGREKYHFLNPMPIAEASDRWIDKYSKARTDAIITLKRALEEKTHGKK